MASKYIILNNRFKPFSYQEMIAPIAAYQQAYDTQEEALSTLADKAEAIGSEITNERDSELKQKYSSYKSQLDTAIDDMYRNGLNASSRKNLISLKRKYSNEIAPIEQAYQDYSNAKKEYSKLAITHPELVVENQGLSISDYMNGNVPTPKVINMEKSAHEAMELAASQASKMTRDYGWRESGIPGVVSKKTSIGLNDAEFSAAMYELQNTEDTSRLSSNAKAIKDIYDNVADRMGLDDLNDASNIGKVQSAIMSGIRKGMQYKETTQNYNIPGWMTDEQLESVQLSNAAKRFSNELNEFKFERDPVTGKIKGFSKEFLDSLKAQQEAEETQTPQGGTSGTEGKGKGSSKVDPATNRVNIISKPISTRIYNDKNSAKRSRWATSEIDKNIDTQPGIPTSYDSLYQDVKTLLESKGRKIDENQLSAINQELQTQLTKLGIFDSLYQHQLFLSINSGGDIDLKTYPLDVASKVTKKEGTVEEEQEFDENGIPEE